MDKLLLYIVVIVGIAIGVAMPSSKRGVPEGAPHRVTTPSEAPRETQLERTGSGHFYTYANVDGQLVKFVVDTGADVVVLTPEDAERAGIKFNSANFDVVGEGAGGPIRGENVMIDSIELDGKLVNDVRGVVIENASRSLLGQSYLSRMGEVQMRGDTMVLR